MMGHGKWYILIFFLFFSLACHERVDHPKMVQEQPDLYPDYAGVTIPATIAPLNFRVKTGYEAINVIIKGNHGGELEAEGTDYVQIPLKKWRKLLTDHTGGSLQLTVSVRLSGQWMQYAPFSMYVSQYPIDYGLVYRLIAPGYEVYSKMGIYQRNLSDFSQTALIENTLIPGSCMNCHSFNQNIPERMSLHIRGAHGGTILVNEGKMEVLETRTEQMVGSCVYPYWHPSGKFIAYSINKTQQAFHEMGEERVEVIDLASDVAVYDIEKNELVTCDLLKTQDFETFPAFSPDGQTLYFCSAVKQELPNDYKKIRYNLCSISFDPESCSFGDRIDTLLNAATTEKSVSFPRPSFDGKYLMYTLSDYGNFSIWHREADLYLMDLSDGSVRALNEVNSDDTESYHNWSSNSHWFVFSSRRLDGLYTRPFIASINDDGRVSKPFLLPQKNPELYEDSFYSYNIPEFVTGPVKLDVRDAEHQLLDPGRKQILVRK